MIVVLGGGITGVAAAGALAGRGLSHLVLERETSPGGHCRTVRRGDYLFDMAGHFMHLSGTEAGKRILALPGLAWEEKARDARVFLRGRLTPFPFQANLHGHDPRFVERCLLDFARERIREATGRPSPSRNFREWLLRTFGRSMCRAFFFPYNTKMWRTGLERLGAEWTGWSIPVPHFDEVLAGARGGMREGMGYNATFFYPSAGGIGAFAEALAAPVRGRLRTDEDVVAVDLGRRRVRTARGGEFPYAAVVSSIPLPRLAGMATGLSSAAREAGRRLRWVKVLAMNFGVRAARRTEPHWVYVPERAYPFYRAGFLSSVARYAAPGDGTSLFVERSFPAEARVDPAKEVRRALAGLRAMGILGKGSRVEEAHDVLLDPAYVLFDARRGAAVRTLRNELARRGVFVAGRYGAWDYYGMERSVEDGIRAAGEAAVFAGA